MSTSSVSKVTLSPARMCDKTHETGMKQNGFITVIYVCVCLCLCTDIFCDLWSSQGCFVFKPSAKKKKTLDLGELERCLRGSQPPPPSLNWQAVSCFWGGSYVVDAFCAQKVTSSMAARVQRAVKYDTGSFRICGTKSKPTQR